MKSLLAAVVAVTAIGMSSAQPALGQSMHVIVIPSELKWAPAPAFQPGAQSAPIEGPLNEAVPFVVRLKFPANFKIAVHWHPAIEHLTIISGTFNLGMGDVLDATKTSAMPAGRGSAVSASSRRTCRTP